MSRSLDLRANGPDVSSKGSTLPSEDMRQIVLGRHVWTPGANGRTRTGGLVRSFLPACSTY